MRRSHMPICFSASVPVHPDTDGPVYALPANVNRVDEIQLNLECAIYEPRSKQRTRVRTPCM